MTAVTHAETQALRAAFDAQPLVGAVYADDDAQAFLDQATHCADSAAQWLRSGGDTEHALKLLAESVATLEQMQRLGVRQ